MISPKTILRTKTSLIGVSEENQNIATILNKYWARLFFHGLDLLNSLESENSKLQSSLTNAISSRDYYKGLVDGTEKTIEDECLRHGTALKDAQDELTKVKGEAKATDEAQQKEIVMLKSEIERL